MKISLIIPAFNEEKYIKDCLLSVVKNQKNLFEVIVVNNASTDGTAQIARSFKGVRVIDEPQKGLPFARSRGLSEARGDIVAYIDADARIPKNWLKIIKSNFENDPKIVCLSGPYIYYDLSFLSKIIVWIYWIILAWPSYLLTGYMVVAGNFVMKKSVFESIGGFDHSISFYGDDTDIARRLSKVGKVKFSQRFFMYTSARRLKGEGFLITAYRYIINFLSVVWFKKPVTGDHKDIR